MIGSINCSYETPCGWCVKWDKKCNKTQIENNFAGISLRRTGERLKDEELAYTTEILHGYGVSVINNNGDYRPVNEVMSDICKKFRQWRSEGVSREEFESRKHNIYKALVGIRNMNELY